MRQWSFVADMNFDRVITVSDCWLWLKWLFYYPGDLAIQTVFGQLPGMVRFFELFWLILASCRCN